MIRAGKSQGKKKLYDLDGFVFKGKRETKDNIFPFVRFLGKNETSQKNFRFAQFEKIDANAQILSNGASEILTKCVKYMQKSQFLMFMPYPCLNPTISFETVGVLKFLMTQKNI